MHLWMAENKLLILIQATRFWICQIMVSRLDKTAVFVLVAAPFCLHTCETDLFIHGWGLFASDLILR